jgi:4-amino-4-deoxy-L-arabinose transferase-like glycosyltransferase
MSPSGITGPRIGRGAWLLVIGLALICRVVMLAIVPAAILWPDGREFEAIGRTLWQHGTYGVQTLRPPGYPTFIAAVYSIFGPSLLALRLVEVVLATLSVAILGAVGARVFGPLAGWLSALFMAVHPVLSVLPSTQYSETLLVFFLILAFAAVYAAWTSGGTWRWALAGALLGGAALVRPNAVLMLPGLSLGLLAALRRDRRAWLAPGLAAAVALILVVSPWIVRCHRVQGTWFFIATGGGRQFFLGNSEHATGSTTDVIPYTPEEQAALSSFPDDVSRERWLYDRGMEFVRHEPVRAARLYLVKLGNLLSLWPETFTQTLVNRWSRLTQGVASVVIFAGAILALFRLRSTPALWPLAGAIVSFVLVQAVFHSVMRYRMAIEPCLLWMAGFGWGGRAWMESLARRARLVA